MWSTPLRYGCLADIVGLDYWMSPPRTRHRGPAQSVQPASGKARQIAYPRSGKPPSFDDIYQITWLRIMFDLRVAILCWATETYQQWQTRLRQRPIPPSGLDLWDVGAASPAECQALLAQHTYDIVILHGACAAIETGSLTRERLDKYANSIPSELIVLA